MDIEEAIETMQHWIDYEKKNKDKINKADELIEVQETILKELDCLKNHVHYINCQKCGVEFRAKRNDRKYCKKCAELVNKKNNKDWYKNLSEEQKAKKREQSKISMRKLRKRRKVLCFYF